MHMESANLMTTDTSRPLRAGVGAGGVSGGCRLRASGVQEQWAGRPEQAAQARQKLTNHWTTQCGHSTATEPGQPAVHLKARLATTSQVMKL